MINRPNIITLAKPNTTATTTNAVKQTPSIIQLNSASSANNQPKIVTLPSNVSQSGALNNLLQSSSTLKSSLSDEFSSLFNLQIDSPIILNNSTNNNKIMQQQSSSQSNANFLESELDDIMSSLQSNEPKNGKYFSSCY